MPTLVSAHAKMEDRCHSRSISQYVHSSGGKPARARTASLEADLFQPSRTRRPGPNFMVDPPEPPVKEGDEPRVVAFEKLRVEGLSVHLLAGLLRAVRSGIAL